MATVVPSYFELLGFSMQGDLAGMTCYTAKGNKVIWFVKSPPLEPPSNAQIQMRNFFRAVGFVWRGMNSTQKAQWNDLANQASLRIHGYNLFTWYLRTRDSAVIETISRQTGVKVTLPGFHL